MSKTKTITIGGGKKTSSSADVTGVDLFGGDARGCPAVRLQKKRDELILVAAGFVPPPAEALPDSWETAAKSVSWSLPSHFQAPKAALAVTSPDMFMSQTTRDAFIHDVAAGGHKKDESTPAPGKKKLGIHRDKPAEAEKPPEMPPPQPAPEAKAVNESEIKPGVPLSNGGTRFVMMPMASEGFIMQATLPEFQLLWLSRLLPEGKRPTAASIQLRPSALNASVLALPAFKSAGGNAIALFAGADTMHVAGYKSGELVLWRECRGVPGVTAIRKAVMKGLGVDEEMIDSVLNDNLIDPRPVLEPLVTPIIDELAISRDYLIGKLGTEPKSAIAVGLGSGIGYWSAISEERAHLPIVAEDAFAGLDTAKVLLGEGVQATGASTHVFAAALGAAMALMEDSK